MKTYTCPSCGAKIEFQSALSIFTVCKYCRSTLVRKDLNLQTLGKMADLIEDATPLQLGTMGRFDAAFVLVGRVRVTWTDGYWNEWFIRFDDGREAWLGEAQGFYMISFAQATTPQIPRAPEIRIGQPVQIGKITFKVDDIKDITYSFAEGELPFVASQGFKGKSVDLRHGENDFASISYGEDGEIDVFVGQYVDFENLQFQNLRRIDGW